MNYRKLGRTDLQLSEITFGAWAIGGWMWGGTDWNEAVKAIKAGYDNGMTSIDTAPIYGHGISEEIVGTVIKDLPRDKVQILTKFGLRWDTKKGEYYFSTTEKSGETLDFYKFSGKEGIIEECERSLKRLGTDYIDLYQVHWYDSTTPISESFEAVERLIEQGKVRFAGVCNYTADQTAIANESVIIASNQVPYSMVNRGIEEDVVPYCINNNMGILAYSPLQRGLLTGKFNENSHFNEGDHRATNKFFEPEFIKRTNTFLERIKPLANDKEVTLGQLVLKWTVLQPGITIALAGARNAEQAKQNAGASSLVLTEEELRFINKELEQL
ncbi:MAG: aldo/keto reductase [Crocinitomicaceae bacterium]|nr:aldo/keto reductase [Crocinitomicaceae bacterium]